jgi:hypothetical protein
MRTLWCLALAGCATVDPALPMRLPDSDHAVGISVALAQRSRPHFGVDYAYLDGVFGLDAGLSIEGEADVARVALRTEALVWYGLVFGLGARVGWLTSRAWDAELATPEPVRPPRFATDLTALVAYPLAVWSSPAGAILIAPYLRPGLRVAPSAHPGAVLSGVHEFGLMLRWSTFSF